MTERPKRGGDHDDDQELQYSDDYFEELENGPDTLADMAAFLRLEEGEPTVLMNREMRCESSIFLVTCCRQARGIGPEERSSTTQQEL